MRVAVVAVVLCMTFFNVAIGIDGHVLLFTRLKTALDGGQKDSSGEPKEK